MDLLEKSPAFTYDFLAEEKCHVLHLKGKLLSAWDAKELFTEIEEQICDSAHLIADISELEMISSDGLNVLLRLLTFYRKNNGDITLCAPNEQLNELFIMTKIDSIFTIAKSTEQTLKGCKSQKSTSNV
jgi:anti-anti-sigma factor